MANVLAIHSVGSSLATYLRNAFPEALRRAHPCEFRLISSGELASSQDFNTMLSLFLYRVTVNEHLRNARVSPAPNREYVPLSLDLHYLLTVWADNALAEHSILAWAMRELYQHPVLDLSSLTPEAGWDSADVIQMIPAELSNEDLMRVWDALEPPYRLSVSYIARMVRIDPEEAPEYRPVVATRFAYADEVSP